MTTHLNKQSVPVNIICGALGAGKTSAIAKLLAGKPTHEFWVVILNEFTDTGIDTLTLAAAAQSSYDVRMIPGGCLCCTGEQDFRRQLSELLSPAMLPARILIEPSGVGHPGGLIEELRVFENSGAINLISTIALIESRRIDELYQLPALMRDQVDAADVVILSKAELADADTRNRFGLWASALFPSKRFIGFSESGALPPAALAPPESAPVFSFLRQHRHQHEHIDVEVREVVVGSVITQARAHFYLQRHACGWVIPPTLMFDLDTLVMTLNQHALFIHVERMKAVLRTGLDRWHLLQYWDSQFEVREISWRQDSRAEVQMRANAPANWQAWDDWLREAADSTRLG